MSTSQATSTKPRQTRADTVMYCRFYGADIEDARNFAKQDGVKLHNFIRMSFERDMARQRIERAERASQAESS
ncbi:hypothetical protein [Comamonas resistens]|uniref:hypothetical protein n=1 Tax=Comamonas resistens TaxID=3046670 RepID=UPI0039BCA90B